MANERNKSKKPLKLWEDLEATEKFEDGIYKLVQEYFGKRNKIKGIVVDVFFEEGSKWIRRKVTFGSATEEELDEIRKRTDAMPPHNSQDKHRI